MTESPVVPPGIALGIDVGGTGVKAALVELATGNLISKRVRIATPKPSTPQAVADTIRVIGFENAVDLIRGGPTAATSFLRGIAGSQYASDCH